MLYVYLLCVVHRIAQTLGFTYAAFTSNLVQIPSGSLTILRQALAGGGSGNKPGSIVLPTMTKVGARHNSAQVSQSTCITS